MPFFSNLAERIGGYTLQLNITKEGDNLVVMLYPQVSDKSEIQEKISPLSIKGTPQELDQNFFASLGVTLDKTKEMATQIKNYEQNLEKAAEKASGKKTTGKKEPAKKEPEKKEPEKEKENGLFDGKTSVEVAAQAEKGDKAAQEELDKRTSDDPNVDKQTGEIKGEQKEEKIAPAPAAAPAPAPAAKAESESEPKETPEDSQQSQEDASGSDQASAADLEDPDENW